MSTAETLYIHASGTPQRSLNRNKPPRLNQRRALDRNGDGLSQNGYGGEGWVGE